MSHYYIGSKWKKTLPLLGNAATRRWVPETARLTQDRLRAMLSRYGTVYVKPDYGMHGRGVMRARRLERGGYELRYGTSRQVYPSLARLYDGISRRKGGRSYLVQQGIPLLQYKGRRFDVRVMVQRTPKGQWEATGVIGRVASAGKVITNFHGGGRPMPVETLLKPHLGQNAIEEKVRSLKRKGETIASVLKRRYPGIREIGVDIGLDRRFKPWVIEVNTMPDPYIFRLHPVKSILRKVLRYARAYGRIK